MHAYKIFKICMQTEEDTDSVQTSTHVHANIMQILKGILLINKLSP